MLIALLLLAVFGFILYFAATSLSYIRQRGTTPEELDLNSVRDAIIEKQGWSLDRAEAARTEYVRFLTLLKMKPGFMLIPWTTADGHDDLDQFWHQHILDTAKYAADCDALFGRMIHHNPHVLRGSETETDAFEKTQRLYARTFNQGSYGRPVNSADLAGCGATFVMAESSDNGHSGHDGGHGHSCGGSHSCGGHSCGGHGCGGH